MYEATHFSIKNVDRFDYDIRPEKQFKILQLTDLHLGFTIFSRKKDLMALHAVDTLIRRVRPDLIVFTGDSVFPYLPKAGTMNNEMQGKKFVEFMDRYRIPYSLVMGNHDTEMGSKLDREELGKVYASGKYAIFSKGPSNIFGVGNYFVNLRKQGKPVLSLAHLDSNMYGDGWFYSGFDRVHPDQTEWCMDSLKELKKDNEELQALAFFHMPVSEFKEAYEQMKLGDKSVEYNFGTIGEKDDYFGISRFEGDFFEKALETGIIKGMFCGHDHYNNLSLTYKGIRLTYGMSIDCLGYRKITKQYIQRGGTLITLETDNTIHVKPVPLTTVVSTRVRGYKA